MQELPRGFTLEGRRENGEEVVKVEWYGEEYYLPIPLHLIRLSADGMFWLRDQGFRVCTAALQARGVLDQVQSKWHRDLPKELEEGLFVFCFVTSTGGNTSTSCGSLFQDCDS
jgi:hypothetical protein